EQRKPDLWVPYDLSEQRDSVEFNRRKMQVFARLRPGLSLDQAREEMNAIGRTLATEDPTQNTGFGINVFPIYIEDVGKDQRRNLLVLFGAVGFVLLIGCTNVANLMLGRGVIRAREMAIRKALGASGRQLISQLLAESLVLSLAGSVLGLDLAHYGIKALIALKPAGINRPEQIHLGLPVFLFTTVVCIIASVAFGIVPAIRAARTDVNALANQNRGVHTGALGGRLRQSLVAVEVALACILVIGAAFMMKSLLAVVEIDPGFRPDHLLTMKFSLPESRYKNNEQIAAFCRQVLDKLSATPDVKSASFSDGLPLTRIRMMRFVTDDRPPPARGSEPTADMRGIFTPEYLDAVGLHLVAGRNFTAAEVADKQAVVIINQILARQLWPNENAIGKRIRSVVTKNATTPVVSTVIGVVADTHQSSLEEPTRPEITKPMLDYTQLTLALRSDSDPKSLIRSVKNQIWAVDKNLPIFEVQTMEQVIDLSTSQRRFESFVMSAFAVLALLLASVGIYGVLASLVAQRTSEIGIRMALGAQTKHVMRLVLEEGFRMIAIGLILGVAGGFALVRVFANLFFGISPTTPGTYCEVVLLMALVAMVACALPAWRAVRLNPVEALRCE
ncbi:MAG TPA: ABC transporter permease, partial [Chthoniobacterales bacterium]